MSAVEISRFSLSVQPDRDRVIVSLSGELDLAATPDVHARLDELLATGWARIVLDVGEVMFVDSAGLHLLLDARERAEREGWEVTVAGACAALDRVAEITRVAGRLGRT
ncbi:MAG TPA: STAS domain-containing protein [Solirubrobacteraceae bacterium]|nr:STAS domain-containing protein [Solirubrobacteraceae bacterium]